jgi:hypothetical protein
MVSQISIHSSTKSSSKKIGKDCNLSSVCSANQAQARHPIITTVNTAFHIGMHSDNAMPNISRNVVAITLIDISH